MITPNLENETWDMKESLKFLCVSLGQQLQQAFGLSKNSKTNNLPLNFNFFNLKYSKLRDGIKLVIRLCALCKKLLLVTQTEPYFQYIESEAKYCSDCSEKIKNTLQ